MSFGKNNSRIAVCGFAIAALLAASARADDAPQWVQVHVDVHFKRSGTNSTSKDGKFSYVLNASLDEVLERVTPNEPDQRADYVLSSDYARSFKLSGTVSLNAELTQYDEATKKTYHADASLTAALSKADDLRLDGVTFNPYLSDGYLLKMPAKIILKGAVHSDYPRMPDVEEQDAVLSWPTPVKFSKDEGFVSEGEMDFYSKLGKRPEIPALGMSFDMIGASEDMPGLGGLRPPALGGETVGKGDDWTFRLKKQKSFDTLVGGNYTDEISVEAMIVPMTLPAPKRTENAE